MKCYFYEDLKALHYQSKCPCECSKTAVENLLKIQDFQIPQASLKMYCSYIIGRYYFRLFKSNGNKGHLEEAHSRFNRIFITANSFMEQVKNPKYHFSRAIVKMELTAFAPKEEIDILLYDAKVITDKALMKFSNNSSIKWLKEKIEETIIINEIDVFKPKND